MTGLKMTTMTLKKMRATRKNGKSKTDSAFLRRQRLAELEPDSPDATHRMLTALAKRRAGRPAGSGKKEQVAIRLDREILSSFRSTGPGWQTRMNDALKDWLVKHATV